MASIFRQKGDSIDYIPGVDVSAGDVIVQNDLVGIAKLDIGANTLGSLALTGVFEMPKATGVSTAIAAGTKVYWDAGNLVVTADDNSGANKYVGKTVKACSDDDGAVAVRLSQ